MARPPASNIYSTDTYCSDMDSQSKLELQRSKVGRPKSNVLRKGVPSKICFLCYGKPLSTYEVAMSLYGQPMANVQNWMKTLRITGYLRKVKRDVQRETGKRPKGESGYQLVASKVADELDRTLSENTHGALIFTPDEKATLTEFLDSSESRNLAAAFVSPSIRQAENYDICSMLSTILWTHASGAVKGKPIDPKYSNVLLKYVQEPWFTDAISKIAKRVPRLLGTSLSGYAEERFESKDALTSLASFSLMFSNFMAKCSPSFVEKLQWCMQPPQTFAYQVTKLSGMMPSIVGILSEQFRRDRRSRK